MSQNRITFRKGKRYQGRMRLPVTYRACRNGSEIATLQQISDETWFWYGDGINTYDTPASLAECKERVREHFKRLYEA